MQHWDWDALRDQRNGLDRPYLEFCRVPALSMGLYVLDEGQEDPQQPHREDEVYHVLAGAAIFEGGEASQPVQPGSVIYVPAGEPHRFTAIKGRLELLVTFSPAESEGLTP
ncbi:MAG TPA: dimethylsulfonioproprionate lyase family protein [bacterium]|nr:dimethylsulfonioproprionate lyase family protein [bacterium]